MRKWPAPVLAACAALAAAAPPPARPAAPVRVLSAGAARHGLLALAPEFQKRTGYAIDLTTGTAGEVLSRTRGGETADVIVATAAGLDQLVKENLAVSRLDLGTVRIGVAVRAGSRGPDLSSAGSFRAALLAARGIGYADPAVGATSGVHFAKVLERLGIAAEMRGKTLLQPGGLQVMARVAAGETELGVSQISEILSVKGVRLVGPIPEELQLLSVYSAGLAKTSEKNPAARALLAFLAGKESRAQFRGEGFDVPE